jgi:glycosyltransferase involved in cell wall biosynthesis
VKLKILIITSKVPYPPHRGDKLKIYNVARLLSKTNKVKIITFYRNKFELNELETAKKKGFDIEGIELPYYKTIFSLHKILYTDMPFQVSAFYSKEMFKRIKQLTTDENFDVAYFHLLVTAQYFDAVNHRTLKVIDFTDAISLYLTRYLKFITNSVKKFIYQVELERTLQYETIANKFNTLFVCSNSDKQFLLERDFRTNIRLFLNGVNTESFNYTYTEPDPYRIIFVGNMEYFPNIDGVIYFSNEILPILLRRNPLVKFYVIGKGVTKQIKSLQSKNIIIKGFVEDLRNEYLISKVNVVPLRLGAGFPNKIIEALALGVPTVASNNSVEGLPDELKQFILTADNPEEFADQILFLLEDNRLKNMLVNEGIEKIKQKLSWKNIVSNFENYLYDQISKNC